MWILKLSVWNTAGPYKFEMTARERNASANDYSAVQKLISDGLIWFKSYFVEENKRLHFGFKILYQDIERCEINVQFYILNIRLSQLFILVQISQHAEAFCEKVSVPYDSVARRTPYSKN